MKSFFRTTSHETYGLYLITQPYIPLPINFPINSCLSLLSSVYVETSRTSFVSFVVQGFRIGVFLFIYFTTYVISRTKLVTFYLGYSFVESRVTFVYGVRHSHFFFVHKIFM